MANNNKEHSKPSPGFFVRYFWNPLRTYLFIPIYNFFSYGWNFFKQPQQPAKGHKKSKQLQSSQTTVSPTKTSKATEPGSDSNAISKSKQLPNQTVISPNKTTEPDSDSKTRNELEPSQLPSQTSESKTIGESEQLQVSRQTAENSDIENDLMFEKRKIKLKEELEKELENLRSKKLVSGFPERQTFKVFIRRNEPMNFKFFREVKEKEEKDKKTSNYMPNLRAVEKETGREFLIKWASIPTSGETGSPIEDMKRELIGSQLYQLLLYNRAPTQALVHKETDCITVRSALFNAIDLADYKGPVKVVDFEKVMAAIHLLGESDFHSGNIMVNQDGEPYAIKIDHGGSFNYILTEGPNKFRNFLKHIYEDLSFFSHLSNPLLTFDINAYSNALEQMLVQISPEQIKSIVSRRLDELKKAGVKVNVKEETKKYRDLIVKGINSMREIIPKIALIRKFTAVPSCFIEEFQDGMWLQTLADSAFTDPIVHAVAHSYKIEGVNALEWANQHNYAIPEEIRKNALSFDQARMNIISSKYGVKESDLNGLSQKEMEILLKTLLDSPYYAPRALEVFKITVSDFVKLDNKARETLINSHHHWDQMSTLINKSCMKVQDLAGLDPETDKSKMNLLFSEDAMNTYAPEVCHFFDLAAFNESKIKLLISQDALKARKEGRCSLSDLMKLDDDKIKSILQGLTPDTEEKEAGELPKKLKS